MITDENGEEVACPYVGHWANIAARAKKLPRGKEIVRRIHFENETLVFKSNWRGLIAAADVLFCDEWEYHECVPVITRNRDGYYYLEAEYDNGTIQDVATGSRMTSKTVRALVRTGLVLVTALDDEGRILTAETRA